MPQRLKAARPVGVVLQEEAVDPAVAKQDLRHRLVSAGGKPGGTEVAAADVHGDDHILRLGLQGEIDHLHIFFFDFVQVQPARRVSLPLLPVAEFAPRGVVKLQIAAAGIVKRADRLLVGCRNIMIQTVRVLIFFDGDIMLFPDAANQMQHGGRGNRHFAQRAAGDGAQIFEMLDERVVFKVYFPDDFYRPRFGLRPFELHRPALGFYFPHALQGRKKIQMPVPPPEFAVGHGLQADLFFLRHQFPDGCVFRFLQLCRADFVPLVGRPRFLQIGRPQETSHDVRAEGRNGSFSHFHHFPFFRFYVNGLLRLAGRRRRAPRCRAGARDMQLRAFMP